MKRIALLALSIALVSAMFVASSFPVFAESIAGSLYLSDVYVYRVDGGLNSWRAPVSWTWNEDSNSTLAMTTSEGYMYGGFRFKATAPGFIRVDRGYYFKFTLELQDNVQPILIDSDTYVHVYIDGGDGETYELTNGFFTFAGERWTYTVIGQVGNGDPMQFGSFRVESNVPSRSQTAAYNIYMYCEISQELTADESRHIETIEEINSIKTEDYGYTKPPSLDIANLTFEDIIEYYHAWGDKFDEASAAFAASLTPVEADINRSKEFIWGWVDYLPEWVIPVFVCLACVLVGRRVIK